MVERSAAVASEAGINQLRAVGGVVDGLSTGAAELGGRALIVVICSYWSGESLVAKSSSIGSGWLLSGRVSGLAEWQQLQHASAPSNQQRMPVINGDEPSGCDGHLEAAAILMKQ